MNKKTIITLVSACVLCTNLIFAAPIHDAATKGDAEKITALIASNANIVNAKDKDNATPLHHAAAKNQTDAVQLLLAKGSNINAAKKDGVTPIHVAAACKSYETASLLMSAGAKPELKDKKGRTALSIAQANKDNQMTNILMNKAKAKKNIPAPTPERIVTNTPQVLSGEKQIKVTEKFVELVSTKQYEKATELFDEKMKASFPSNQLQMLWETAITAQTGEFKEISSIENSTHDNIPLVYAICAFEKISVRIQFAFDTANKISSLYVLGSE